jgi:Ca2+-binding EF-hand superfamily protein
MQKGDFEKYFVLMDVNHDGSVDKEEMLSFLRNHGSNFVE